jgi:DNA polymerase delta subunit 1
MIFETLVMDNRFNKLVRQDTKIGDQQNVVECQVVDVQIRTSCDVAQAISCANDTLSGVRDTTSLVSLNEDNRQMRIQGYPINTTYNPSKSVALIFTCTSDGGSMCLISYFRPFIFVKIPDKFSFPFFLKLVVRRLRDMFPKVGTMGCTREEMAPVYNYTPSVGNPYVRKKDVYIKLSLESLWSMKIVSNILQKGLNLDQNYRYSDRYSNRVPLVVEETYIDPLTKFSEISGVVMGGWLSVVVSNLLTQHLRLTTCQHEYYVKSSDLKPINVTKIAPLLLASIDVEANSSTFDDNDHSKARFPNPLLGDQTIGIGVTLQILGDSASKQSYYFSLHETALSKSVHVFDFKTEKDLLLGYRDFMVHQDPDVIMHYNGNKFDNQWIGQRWNEISKKKPLGTSVSRFYYQSRIYNEEHILKANSFQSSAYGESTDWVIPTPGRIQLDMMVYIRRQPSFIFRNYKLSTVSMFFLHDDKLDISPSTLFRYFRMGSLERSKIAEYCAQDCDLVLRLVEKTSALQNIFGMSQVTNTLPQHVISGGQQKKIMNLIVPMCHNNGFVITKNTMDKLTIQGASVLEPMVGFYNNPVATLDFKSLYPSIMIAWNLSHDTYITPLVAQSLPNEMIQRVVVSPGVVDNFVKKEFHKGILTTILQGLLSERQKFKDLIKVCVDDDELKILSAIEKSYKICTNSIYGFTGAQVGKLPHPNITRSVTSLGRSMIAETTAIVHETQPFAKVIYGDTDSVMIHYDGESLSKAFSYAHNVVETVNSVFEKKVNVKNVLVLEMEKVTLPYWLPCKKKYAGLFYTSPTSDPKLDVKGMITRRDTIPFVQSLQRSMIETLMFSRDITKCLDILFEQLSRLLTGQVPMSELSVSCQMKSISSYVSKNLPQVAVALKMKARQPGSEPKAGDIINYVIVHGGSNKKSLSHRAEELKYAQDHKLLMDNGWVIKNQMASFVESILKFITHDYKKVLLPFIAFSDGQYHSKMWFVQNRDPCSLGKYPPIFSNYVSLDPLGKCDVYEDVCRRVVKKMKQTVLSFD